MLKTIEFDSTMTDSDELRLPIDIRQQIPPGANMRVILILHSGDDDHDDLVPLREMAMARFFAAYDESDLSYDDVPNDAQSR